MLMKLSDQKEIVYGVSSKYALSTIDDRDHPEIYVHLEDDEAIALLWEILKTDAERYNDYLRKIKTIAVGSCDVVNQLNKIAKAGKLPYSSVSIVDGDKKTDYPDCLSLPGTEAPERMVFQDLKELGWNKLDDRFSIGSGSLFEYLDNAMLIPDHHEWTEYVGDKIKKKKSEVWSILIDEWCKQCLDPAAAEEFIHSICEQLTTHT